MAYGYVKRQSARAKETPGESYVEKGKKPKLGTGKRFAALESNLEKRGVNNPAAVAASIGRKKYGSKKMVQMAVRRKLAKSA